MKRRLVTVGIVVVGLAVLVLFGVLRVSEHRLQIKAYFQNAQGLRAGAPVRLAGVNIGYVTSVRVRPQLPQKAAEVVMDIRTSYPLSIPKDAIVSLDTTGVLGETLVEINVKNASGAPIGSGGVLQSEKSSGSSEELPQKIGEALKSQPCEPGSDTSKRK